MKGILITTSTLLWSPLSPSFDSVLGTSWERSNIIGLVSVSLHHRVSKEGPNSISGLSPRFYKRNHRPHNRKANKTKLSSQMYLSPENIDSAREQSIVITNTYSGNWGWSVHIISLEHHAESFYFTLWVTGFSTLSRDMSRSDVS